MRRYLFLFCLWPLLASAAPLRVLSITGTPQQVSEGVGHPVGVGDGLPLSVQIVTPQGSRLQVGGGDGLTLDVGSSTDVTIDFSKHSLDLHSGQISIWSDSTDWLVRTSNSQMRSRGFLRLRLCDAVCSGVPGLYVRTHGGQVTVEYLGGRSVIRDRFFRVKPEGGRPEMLGMDNGVLAGEADFSAAISAKRSYAEKFEAALVDFKAEHFDAARASLESLRKSGTEQPLVSYYLGLIALQQERRAEALTDLQAYQRLDPLGSTERDVGKLITLLSSEALQIEVRRAVANEKEINALPPERGTIAVHTFTNQTSGDAAILAKGVAAMVVSDLSQVPGLRVLEREKVQKLMDELRLQNSGLVQPDSPLRIGRLVRAEHVVVGNVGVDQ